MFFYSCLNKKLPELVFFFFFRGKLNLVHISTASFKCRICTLFLSFNRYCNIYGFRDPHVVHYDLEYGVYVARWHMDCKANVPNFFFFLPLNSSKPLMNRFHLFLCVCKFNLIWEFAIVDSVNDTSTHIKLLNDMAYNPKRQSLELF